MKNLLASRRTISLIAVLALLAVAFGYVALRSGPFKPIPITVTTVESLAIAPSLFGIGTVEARYTYRIGPTVAGRVTLVHVNVGDMVEAGQQVAEMDPVDLGNRIASQEAALKRAQSSVLVAEAQVRDAAARSTYAEAQTRRYDELLLKQFVSEEADDAKRQEHQIAIANFDAAGANLNAAKQDIARVRADRNGLIQQRANLRLLAPVNGLVVARDAEPGTTVVAGQAIVEIIDPTSLWINVRFDQSRAFGLRADLPTTIVLRSRAHNNISGHVARTEPRADAVTEETLAKVVFDQPLATLPPIGELAEVTVALPELAAAPTVPNAALKHLDGKTGVWVIEGDVLSFAPVRVGTSDLDGRVQILEGLKVGDRVVVYSRRDINARSRIKIVDSLTGNKP
jgi:HlyD family secretion protein